MVLWSGCFGGWVIFLTRSKVDPRLWTDCKLFYFMFLFGKHYSSMLLVLLSIEKCFAVYFPLKAKSICTVRMAKWATGIFGVILAGYNIIQFFTYSQFSKPYGRYVCSSSFNRNVELILDNVDSALYSFGPFILMFITNSAIVFKFMKAKCKSNSTESTNQALVKSATRGTAMVVTVSITFLILTAPTAMHMILLRWYNLAYKFPLYRAFINLTQYLNHSINGVLYCIVGSRFRKELLKIFCRKKRPEVGSSSSSINNTGLVTISGSRT